MRILHLVTVGEAGGAQSVVRALAEGAEAAGEEVAVAYGTEVGAAAWEGMADGIERIRLPNLRRSISPVRDLAALREIGRTYRSWRADIIHLHTSKAAALGRLAPGARSGRIVYTMHGYDQLRQAHRKLLPVDRALRGRCAAVVAVSEYDRRLMSADGYDPVLIPNGTSDTRALAEPAGEGCERLAAIRRSGRMIALVIAREARPKRIDLAREAARLLEGRAMIAWIGGGPRADDPAGFVALGSLSGAAAYLRLADIALLPSDHEGAPISVLEAMSAGIPVVASGVGGVPKQLGIGGPAPGGACVENKAEAFAAEILRLATDATVRAGMGAAGRNAWEDTYSAERMCKAYLELYRRLAGGQDWFHAASGPEGPTS